MVARTESRPGGGVTGVPPAFTTAVATLRTARLRPEIHCEEMPAPQRIAPYAAALAADVTVDGDEVGTGRLILLHDPAGNDAWDGVFRCVAYARADIDLELISDPLLAGVGWAWLIEALAGHDAGYHSASGTVTRVATENFGGMADDLASAQLEIRASWTPVPPDTPTPSGTQGAQGTQGTQGTQVALDVGPHVEAWGELLCMAVGLPPVPDGVSLIPNRRGQRGPGPG